MPRSLFRVTPLLAVAAAIPLLAAEAPGPQLRPGRWRFERSLEYADGRAPGPPIVAERCGDPEESGRKAIEVLRRMGCSYERERTGSNIWTQRLTCDGADVPNGRSISVLQVTDADAFDVRIENDGAMATPVVREHLTAKRLGDC